MIKPSQLDLLKPAASVAPEPAGSTRAELEDECRALTKKIMTLERRITALQKSRPRAVARLDAYCRSLQRPFGGGTFYALKAFAQWLDEDDPS